MLPIILGELPGSTLMALDNSARKVVAPPADGRHSPALKFYYIPSTANTARLWRDYCGVRNSKGRAKSTHGTERTSGALRSVWGLQQT